MEDRRDLENFTEFEDSGSEFNPQDFGSDNSTSSSDNQGNIQRNQELLAERVNFKGRPRKGRKTKFPGQTFNTRKQLKDSNKRHYSVNGKLIEPKTFIDFHCNCPLKCNDKIPAPEREKLFCKFWQLQSYNTQTGFICGTVKQQGVKRKRNKESNKRKMTRIYQLNNVTVCRNMYISTFQISTKRVDTSLKKISTGNLKDERGKSGARVTKSLSEETINMVKCHIAKFPTYISHYSRNETESKFLAPDLTFKKMYMLYLDGSNQNVSFSSYKKIFYQYFNLRRKPPIKDTCNICDELNTKIKNSPDDDTKIQQTQLHHEHLRTAEAARKAMKADIERATKEKGFEAVTYDMQKVLGLPKIPTNIVYYKRQLSLYNEGVHTGSTNIPYFFLWKEGIAGRGAQEVGSCIKKFIDVNLAPDTEELTLWSDSCGGQNRNIKIVLMLKSILETHRTLKYMYLKYLMPGHSYLANDTDFGEIERAMKYQIRMYTLDDFSQMITNCSKKSIVYNMQKDDFLSTEDLEKNIVNRKTDINGEKISWLKARVIKISKDCPFSIFLKYTHEEEEGYKEIDIKKKLRGRQAPELFYSKSENTISNRQSYIR